MSVRRGEVWRTLDDQEVLVISSNVYNEIAAEPTVLTVPVVSDNPDAGFGVPIEGGWAAAALVSAQDKDELVEPVRQVGVQALTDVSNMLFLILATPDR